MILFFHEKSNATDGTFYDNVELMKILADTFDDDKKNHLSEMGLKRVSLVKSKAGSMIAERYSNANHTLSATVNRNESTGDVTSIEKITVSRQGSVIDKWNLNTNNYSHTIRHNGKVETVNVSTSSCNLTTLDGAVKSTLTKEACQLLTQANTGAGATKPDAAAATMPGVSSPSGAATAAPTANAPSVNGVALPSKGH